jgi:hypothetical protein
MLGTRALLFNECTLWQDLSLGTKIFDLVILTFVYDLLIENFKLDFIFFLIVKFDTQKIFSWLPTDLNLCPWPSWLTYLKKAFVLFVCLFVRSFVCLQPPEQFFSYPAAVTSDRAANLDLCLALVSFSSEGSFSYHTYCDAGLQFIRPHPKDRHGPYPTVGFVPGTQGSPDLCAFALRKLQPWLYLLNGMY